MSQTQSQTPKMERFTLKALGSMAEVEVGYLVRFTWGGGTTEFATRSNLDDPTLFGITPEEARMLQEALDRFKAANPQTKEET